ncbi:MAG TPA: hypothetical protein VIS75_10800 [Chitinophagaceae bacterium]
MTKSIFLIFFPIMILQSCITSLQPLVTKNTAVTDSRLTGTWNSEGQDYTIQKVFESGFYNERKNASMGAPFKRDSILFSKSYAIHYMKNKIKYDLYGSMIKLNGEFYMNFTNADMNQDDTTGLEMEVCPTCLLQTYTIARIRFSNSNTIKLDFIDGDFLYKQINAGRMKLKHETDELYDTFLITASTYELQQFIQKYGNDDRFFDKENSVTLIRKS